MAINGASKMVLVVKNPPANAEDIRDTRSIPGLEGSPGGGHGHPLQYSCLENSMDKRAWWATVHVSSTYRKELDMTEQLTLFFSLKIRHKGSMQIQVK